MMPETWHDHQGQVSDVRTIIPEARIKRKDTKLHVGYLITAFVYVFLNLYLIEFPSIFDEAAHYSYISHLSHGFSVFPHLDDMTMMLPVPSLNLVVGDQNYINHPVLYYGLMVPIYHLFDGNAWALRLTSSLIHVSALVLLVTCFKVFFHRWILFSVLIIALFIMPLPHILGAFITNDVLVFFSGCLLVLAIVQSRTHPKLGYAGTLIAVLVAGFTKLTALVLIFPIYALTFVMAPLPMMRPRLHLALAIGVGTLASIPYLVWLSRYGSVVPSFSEVTFSPAIPLTPQSLLETVTSAPFLAFVDMMTLGLAYTLFEGSAWLPPDIRPMLFGVLAAALVLAGPVEVMTGNRAMAALFASAAIGAAIFAGLHVLSLYPQYELTGDVRAFHARYYLVVMPILMLAVGRLIQHACRAVCWTVAVGWPAGAGPDAPGGGRRDIGAAGRVTRGGQTVSPPPCPGPSRTPPRRR